MDTPYPRPHLRLCALCPPSRRASISCAVLYSSTAASNFSCRRRQQANLSVCGLAGGPLQQHRPQASATYLLSIMRHLHTGWLPLSAFKSAHTLMLHHAIFSSILGSLQDALGMLATMPVLADACPVSIHTELLRKAGLLHHRQTRRAPACPGVWVLTPMFFWARLR